MYFLKFLASRFGNSCNRNPDALRVHGLTFFFITLDLRVELQKSMSLKYEPSSKPLDL